jgi:phosphomannomutase/phosphoglucomutase
MLFGTNGVRGKFDLLDPELALKLAMAIGRYFGSGKVLVARDGRITGECLKHAVISGLESAGCEVVDLDYASAPTAEFMVKKLKADGLVIITASHNPPEWNALKVVDGKGVTISKERGEEIEKLMDNPAVEWEKVKLSTSYPNATKEHIEAIIKLMDADSIRKRKPKIVLDCGNGMAALIAPQLFKELGCETILLNEKVDGKFPGRPSEPTEANVEELIKTVKKTKADGGIAWDGDGDRVIFIDEKGSFIVGDKVLALCESLKLRKGNILKAVVTTVATSKVVEDVAAKYGCNTIYTKIGAPYLSEEMLRSDAVIGGEEVGGVIWPELSLAKEGFLTGAKMAEMLCEKKLSEWVADIPEYFNEKTKIECDDEGKMKIVEEMTKYAKEKKLTVVSVDGVRINFPDSWVIVRASGTEHYVRVFAEAKTKQKAKKLMEEYKKIAEGLLY